MRRQRFQLIAVAAFSIFLFQSSLAQAPGPVSLQEVVSKVDEYMKAAVDVDKFSGTVLLARDGKPIISKGYGMANYEWDIPNTPQTAFRLGSITKQFTSASIMMLQERGKLSVTDPVCKYVTDCPAAWQPITLRNLLTHTSGIPNYTNFPTFGAKAVLPLKPADLLMEYKDKPLDFVPGEKYTYSNSAYHLLGLVIERVAGQPYADFLQENIFMPLGMKQSGYDNSKSLVKYRAAGYSREGDKIVNAAYMDMWIPYSAGALYSTTGDLLKWEQALYTDKLLTHKSRDEMFTPFKNNYAYGWGVGKRHDRAAMSHGGGIYGFTTTITRFPDDRTTVVVLSNIQGTSTDKVASAITAIAFGVPYRTPIERKAISVPSQILERYVGEYQLTGGLIITVTNEGGKLMMQVTGQGKNETFADSENTFFLKAVDAQITFEKDAAGKVVRLILHQGGNNPAAKIK